METMLRTYETLRHVSDYAFEKNPGLRALFKSLINVNGRYLGFYYDTDLPYDYDTLAKSVRILVPEEYFAISNIVDKEISIGLIGTEERTRMICSDIASIFEKALTDKSIEGTIYSYYDNTLFCVVEEISKEINPYLQKL